ncbi:hypothetical protein BT67DRAFT_438661 [Trichocladium antarcticum]|uniref:Uncharacterized protein n=1 Tax=Trichocladium antarcticum TaxID=1450529 RepID=A0AAN6UQK0_9PEZI|nr:hypothetical protein BT67DRAFT_438661 [Trichocladium antarcticum]
MQQPAKVLQEGAWPNSIRATPPSIPHSAHETGLRVLSRPQPNGTPGHAARKGPSSPPLRPNRGVSCPA